MGLMKSGGAYKKGVRFERERVEWHYANGAAHATRTPGSHSPIDVVAQYCDRVVNENCKSGKASISKEERFSIAAIKAKGLLNAEYYYLRKPDRQPIIVERL